jgi:hypothetical protein
MRRSTLFFVFITGLALTLLLLLIRVPSEQAGAAGGEAVREALVRDLMLTDLCLFTEARYTRNPAVTDFHSAFQDHPLSIEHFPSGALVSPPLFSTGKP